jgi:hypothetical protein
MEYSNILLTGCVPLLLAACAASPPQRLSNVAAAPPTCAQIAASRAGIEEQRQEALEEQANAWKALVPLVAAAKLAQSSADLRAAEHRLAELDSRARRIGCGTAG